MAQNKGGRPRKEIDKKQFENLCGLQCTKEEICSFFELTDKTLESWCKRTYKAGFSEVFRQKRGKGKISLRRYQFELAKKNANMAIWLGKNYLGQKDSVDVSVDTGQLADLIDGLKEPVDDDIYAETAGIDGAVAQEQAETD